MPATLLALQVFLILLPGFSAAYIVQALGARRSQSDFERVIEALVFSFVICICDMPLNHGRLPLHVQYDPSGKGNESVFWEPAQFGWLALITLAFALLAVAYIRFDGSGWQHDFYSRARDIVDQEQWNSEHQPLAPSVRVSDRGYDDYDRSCQFIAFLASLRAKIPVCLPVLLFHLK